MIGQVTTVVAFHAHPDDEVLLTGGTLAKLAAEGNRVVIVVATDGIMGQASDRRLRELQASADKLGAARVVHLGYADSGHGPVLFPDPPGRVRFARADLDQAAAQLAGINRDYSPRERTPVRSAEASRAGCARLPALRQRPGSPAHPAPHPPAYPCLRSLARIRVVRRTRPRPAPVRFLIRARTRGHLYQQALSRAI